MDMALPSEGRIVPVRVRAGSQTISMIMEDLVSANVAIDESSKITRKGREKADCGDIQHSFEIKGWYRSSGGPYRIDPNRKAYAVCIVYSTGDSYHNEWGLVEVMMVNQNFEMVEKNMAALEQAGKDEASNVELFLDDGTTFQMSTPFCWSDHLERADYEPIDEISGRMYS